MNTELHTEKRPTITGRLWGGAVIITIGVLFLLDNMGVLDAGEFWFYWPLALVGLGFVKLFSPGRASGRAFGLFLIVGGLWLQLDALGFVVFSFHYFWPLALIFIGITMMSKAVRRGRRSPESGSSANTDLSMTAILSSNKQTNTAQSFRGGDATAIMGAVEMDLRQASIASGTEAVVDNFAVMGSIEIKVPKDWTVLVTGTPLLGAFEDKTSQVPGPVEKRLIIKGVAIMGAVEITN